MIKNINCWCFEGRLRLAIVSWHIELPRKSPPKHLNTGANQSVERERPWRMRSKYYVNSSTKFHAETIYYREDDYFARCARVCLCGRLCGGGFSQFSGPVQLINLLISLHHISSLASAALVSHGAKKSLPSSSTAQQKKFTSSLRLSFILNSRRISFRMMICTSRPFIELPWLSAAHHHRQLCRTIKMIKMCVKISQRFASYCNSHCIRIIEAKHTVHLKLEFTTFLFLFLELFLLSSFITHLPCLKYSPLICSFTLFSSRLTARWLMIE